MFTEDARLFSSIADVYNTEPMASHEQHNDSSYGNGKVPIAPFIVRLKEPIRFAHFNTRELLI
jgi:hypothetical protein